MCYEVCRGHCAHWDLSQIDIMQEQESTLGAKLLWISKDYWRLLQCMAMYLMRQCCVQKPTVLELSWRTKSRLCPSQAWKIASDSRLSSSWLELGHCNAGLLQNWDHFRVAHQSDIKSKPFSIFSSVFVKNWKRTIMLKSGFWQEKFILTILWNIFDFF